MGVRWVSDGCLMGVRWVSDVCQMVLDRNVDMKAADAFGVRGVRCDPDEGIGGVFDSIEG